MNVYGDFELLCWGSIVLGVVKFVDIARFLKGGIVILEIDDVDNAC